jgi:hypothetical protein
VVGCRRKTELFELGSNALGAARPAAAVGEDVYVDRDADAKLVVSRRVKLNHQASDERPRPVQLGHDRKGLAPELP